MILNTLLSALVSAVITVSAFLGFSPEPQATLSPEEIQRLVTVRAEEILALQEDQLGAQLAALHTYTLSGAGVSSSATSITLSSLALTQPDPDQKLIASDLAKGGDAFYLTLEPGKKSRQEIASCSTVVQNSSGTATLGGCTRGLSPISPFTASTTLRFAHGGSTNVIFSDPPQVFDLYAGKSSKTAITGQWSFLENPVFFASATPYFTSLPTISSSTQITTKDYVDGVALLGSPVAASTSISGVARPGEPIELASSTNALLTVHGTTSPFFVSSLNTTANPTLLRDTATSTWYVPVTMSDAFLHPNFIATSTKWAYRWGGLATFGVDDSSGLGFQGFGIGTVTPGVANWLTTKGDVLIGATTTASGYVSTSTAFEIGGVQYEYPASAPASSTVMVADGNNVLSWQFTNGYLAETLIPTLSGISASTTLAESGGQTGNDVLMGCTANDITQDIIANSVSVEATLVTTGGTFDLTMYSQDGQTQIFSVTTDRK